MVAIEAPTTQLFIISEPSTLLQSNDGLWRVSEGGCRRLTIEGHCPCLVQGPNRIARGAIADPSSPAEEAFLTAIAVAKPQGARSFGLRAALSLAKVCQSTGRPAEAHAVLAPALWRRILVRAPRKRFAPPSPTRRRGAWRLSGQATK